MFEKEAEEIAKDIYIHHFDDDVDYPDVLKAIAAGVQNGAEFGYNKANEWHYPSKGELPKDEDWKWCVSYRGYYYVAKYEEMFGCWTNQEHSEVMQPYAWKEIVLPELKESE